MNQSLLLHVVERLEGLVGKLPGTIQKPILSELTPLKELFLQQRPPRFLFSGSKTTPLPELVRVIFAGVISDEPMAFESYRWHDVMLVDRGTISILDAREAEAPDEKRISIELEERPADIIFFVDDGDTSRRARKSQAENLMTAFDLNDRVHREAKLIGVAMPVTKSDRPLNQVPSDNDLAEATEQLQMAFESRPALRDRWLRTCSFAEPSELQAEANALMSMLARRLPNEARIEMIRVSGDRQSQAEVAQILVKSTTAICTAIGAQPIPLADLPILTTLQLVMVSGIMYLSGRERSLRAATEFVAALGANIGAGMLLREGTRFLLKFIPGWGNIVSGMVAGAGTYAIGRAATAFFLEGVSIKDARRTYLTSRKKARQPELMPGEGRAKERAGRK